MSDQLYVGAAQRSNIFEEALRVALQGLRADIWTAMPGIVQSVGTRFNRQVAKVLPATQARVRNPDGTVQDFTLPVLSDVLLVFPSGGGFTLTFPVSAGDEVLLVFASRCIDAWFQSGMVGPQVDFRMHNLSDGFALCGVKSIPNLLDSVSTDSTQLRSNDGTTYIEVKDGQLVNVIAPGGITLNGITIDGSGNIVFPGTMTNGAVRVDATHFHIGVMAGGSDSGPVGGPP